MASKLCCGFQTLLGSTHCSNLDEGYTRREEYAISSMFEFMWITIHSILRIWGINSCSALQIRFSVLVQHILGRFIMSDAFDGEEAAVAWFGGKLHFAPCQTFICVIDTQFMNNAAWIMWYITHIREIIPNPWINNFYAFLTIVIQSYTCFV